MNTKQIAKARTLENEGYSQREIAAEMGIPLSTVNRTLKAERDGMGDLEDEEGDTGGTETKKTVTNSEVALTALKLEHERKMAEIAFRQKQADAQAQELKIKEQSLLNENQKLSLRQQQQQNEDAREFERVEARKGVMVSKLNRLVQEILDNCKDSTWEADDVNEFIERAESLQEKVEKFCARHGIDEEELAIWHHLKALLKFWEKAKDELSGWFSSDVSLDLEKAEIAEIKGWKIDSFDDSFEGDDDDEDEDNDDDEDEDNDGSLKGLPAEKTLVKKVNELVQSLHEFTEGDPISVEDFDEFRDSVDQTRQDVLTYAKSNGLKPKTLTITRTLDRLVFWLDKSAKEYDDLVNEVVDHEDYYGDDTEDAEGIRLDIVETDTDFIQEAWPVKNFRDQFDSSEEYYW